MPRGPKGFSAGLSSSEIVGLDVAASTTQAVGSVCLVADGVVVEIRRPGNGLSRASITRKFIARQALNCPVAAV
jgi:hypothetical protein